MRKGLMLFVSSILLISFGCTQTSKDSQLNSLAKEEDDSYLLGIDTWHQERIQRLKQPDSWLALSGLYWLQEGVNTFGSSDKNDFVFPDGKIVPQAGSFVLANDSVILKLNPTIKANVEREIIEGQRLIFEKGKSEVVAAGPLTWVVIKRGDKYGLRVWDSESSALKSFTGIERFPVSKRWKLDARLEKNPLPKRIAITNVLGQTTYEPSPGAVVFQVDGKSYRLDALEEGDELFIIFGDKTNGSETYGSGRYLYIPKPKSGDKTIIDFNKAYNPPCAFTDFATCPLPPKQNLLPISVEAGEKDFHSQH